VKRDNNDAVCLSASSSSQRGSVKKERIRLVSDGGSFASDANSLTKKR
jgi:hypothetical protein